MFTPSTGAPRAMKLFTHNIRECHFRGYTLERGSTGERNLGVLYPSSLLCMFTSSAGAPPGGAGPP